MPDGLDPGRHEWLVTNGLGGFASSTLAMAPTRRYHGLLVAAEGDSRTMVLSRLDETLIIDDEEHTFAGGTPADAAGVQFRLDVGLPVWTLRTGSAVIERRVVMPHGQNAVHVQYRLLAGPSVHLRLQPWMQVRRLEEDVSRHTRPPAVVEADECECALRVGDSCLTMRMRPPAQRFVAAPHTTTQHYPMEAARGYPAVGELWSPGWFDVVLEPGGGARFDAVLHARSHAPPVSAGPEGDERHRREGLLRAAPHLPGELVLAADQFLVGRAPDHDARRLGAPGVIAGYHWFGRWGRDTMISLDGLTLRTGRAAEAEAILRESVRHVRRGLIPNLFPDEGEPQYHTADATLWLFHAVQRWHMTTGSIALVVDLLPALRDIVAWHRNGTDFNIRIDPADELLTQGVPNLPLTWMDAKIDEWVVTPRRGKAVELQALWYNALRLLAGWEREFGDAAAAKDLDERAERTRVSFNERFWNARESALYDVVDGDDGDDPSCRPNQLFAFSLEHPVLDARRWEAVLRVVERELLTPVGLRTLSPRDGRYQPRYDGDRRHRDAAYHQGTVWPWLIGPYADACRRARGDDERARHIAHALLTRENRVCAGQVAEIHDADAPYAPRGCVAQAWSVAEVIRCLDGTRPPAAAG